VSCLPVIEEKPVNIMKISEAVGGFGGAKGREARPEAGRRHCPTGKARAARTFPGLR